MALLALWELLERMAGVHRNAIHGEALEVAAKDQALGEERRRGFALRRQLVETQLELQRVLAAAGMDPEDLRESHGSPRAVSHSSSLIWSAVRTGQKVCDATRYDPC